MIRSLQRLLRRARYGEPVIIVSGTPRSGTSMMMQMLEAGGIDIVTDHTREPDESNPRGYYELERVKSLEQRGDTSWLKDARGKAVKIIAYLLEHLPTDYNYRVLFMLRALDETLKSQRAMLERTGQPGGADDERMRQLLIDHVTRTRRQLADRAEFETLYVRHDLVLADPIVQAARIGVFLRRNVDPDAMAAAVDHALYRSRATDRRPNGQRA